MVRVADPSTDAVPPAAEDSADRRWWWRLAPPVWVVWGASSAVLLAVDGSPGWRLLRALAALALAAGGVVLARRRSGWSVPAALAAGTVGLVAGAVVGLRDALAGGWPLRAAAGLTVAVAGLLLVVAGGAELLHRVPRWWRLAVVPALVVGVLLAAFVVGPAVAATNVPRLPDGDRTPADVGVAAEDVRLVTSDGVALAAWWVPSANGAAVVLRHGAGSTRDDVLDQLAVLAGAGYGVLATDARGHGDSGGRAMDFGWYGDRDIDAALAWLATRDGVDPGRLALVGMSMGGEEAVGMAADPRVRAVVAEGVTGRTDADRAWLADAYGAAGTVQRGIEWARTRVTDLLTAAGPPTPLATAVAEAGAPVLLVTADLDDEVNAATWLQGHAPDRVEVYTVDGAAHTGGLRTAPEAWSARVVGFLDGATGART